MARSLGVILMSVQHPLELKYFDDNNNKNNEKNGTKSNNECLITLLNVFQYLNGRYRHIFIP